MNVITALLFFLSGLFGGSSLIPQQFFHVSNLMTWTQAQSYCIQKYTDLVFVYSEEDLDKMRASLPTFAYGNAWIGGYELNSDSQNNTESEFSVTQEDCLAININSWKKVKKDCSIKYTFFCSQSEGKRVVLQLKVNTDGQMDLKDPGIRSNMLDKINEKFNKIGFGDAIKIRWITRWKTESKKRANNPCDLDTN